MKRPIMLFIIFLVLGAKYLNSQPIRIEVDAAKKIRAINPWLYGINTARWDESLFPEHPDEMLLTADRDAIKKIKASGITLLKYPGGNDADSYIWNSPDNNVSEMQTDEYIALCREVGAAPFITINFNQTPELAAEWVRYCNREKGYDVKLWEIGDERWGTWAKGYVPPEEYAKKYILFVQAMRAVDPDIKVATNVPLGYHREQWTERVLRSAVDYVDMLTFTYFPQQWGKENDDSLMASVGVFEKLVLQLREDVERVVGKKKADEMLYVNVGYNSVNHSPGHQTLQMINALFTADMLGVMARTGIDIGCFWALHNFYPPRGGDFGFMSSEGKNTPRYSYYVLPLFSKYLKGELVESLGGGALVSTYAARDGKALSIAFLNKDRRAIQYAQLQVKNFTPLQKGMAYILDATREMKPFNLPPLSGTMTLKLPPYSLIMVNMIDSDSTLQPENLTLNASAAASSFSTIGPHFTPPSAIDGKMHTRWNSAAWTKSNGEESQWFQLRWKTTQTIRRIRIHWGESPAQEYEILLSSDGAHWKTVKKVAGGRGGTEEYSFDAQRARQLKIIGKKGTKGISAYSIREIEVFKEPMR
ncbi:MAG: discoidin domain-containing protein [bacterium]